MSVFLDPKYNLLVLRVPEWDNYVSIALESLDTSTNYSIPRRNIDRLILLNNTTLAKLLYL